MPQETKMERMRSMFEKYPMLFAVGLAILAIGLALMGWRQVNEQTRLAEIFAGRGPPNPSAAYVAANQLELALVHIIEQLIFVGLGALKLGIGFSIAVIVLNLRETGIRSLEAFNKAGVAKVSIPAKMPWFTKFPLFLIVGFSIVVFFFLLTFLWVYNEYVPLGDQVTTRMVLEAVIKPGKMIGTGFLLLGIGTGLATIVMNLRMQAQALPALLVATARGTKVTAAEVLPAKPGIPRKLLVPLVFGFLVIVSAYVPVAAVLAWNRAANLTSAGWSSAAAESLEVALEHWIESYVLTGVSILLFGIGLWLVTIIRGLRMQRERFLGGLAEITGKSPPSGPAPRALKAVPVLLAAGLAVVFLALAFTVVWIQAGLQAVTTGALSAEIADHVWESFIKPFKFAGLAIVFIGIGVALSLIVINLNMLAMILPGVFARFSEAAQGREPQPLDLPSLNPMKLFPKKLFAGILIGFAVIVTSTFPLGWPLRVGTFATFLPASLTADVAAQAALALERFLEHLILPYKLTGLGIIFYSIGRYFATIIGFVRARKAIVMEGVESLVVRRATQA